MKTIYAISEHAGRRLDQAMAVLEPDVSRQRWQEWIEAREVTVNQAASKPSYKLREGDRIDYTLPPPDAPPDHLIPESIPLDVVYEDEWLIVLNKPRGLAVHPSPGHPQGTMVNALLAQYINLSTGSAQFRPGIVHRLDKDTTGLIIVAREDKTHWRLGEMLQNRQIHRQYLALVWGEPRWQQTHVELWIGRHPVDRKKMAVYSEEDAPSGARHAQTDFEACERYPGFALLEATLHTGRTHQVRLHAMSLGHPVVGDPLYGGERRLPQGLFGRNQAEAVENALRGLGGQALHAYSLEFIHPITQQPLAFRCDPPADFQLLRTSLQEEK